MITEYPIEKVPWYSHPLWVYIGCTLTDSVEPYAHEAIGAELASGVRGAATVPGRKANTMSTTVPADPARMANLRGGAMGSCGVFELTSVSLRKPPILKEKFRPTPVEGGHRATV
jgi:hypothetical protein